MKYKIFFFIAFISCFSCKKYSENTPVIEKKHQGCCGIYPEYSINDIQFIVDGNSLVQGYYVTNGLPPDLSGNYPDYIETTTGVPTENLGYGGITIWQMVGRGTYVDNNYVNDSIGTVVFIVDEATNSLMNGISGDSTYKGFIKYCQDRRATHPNVKIILVAPTPRSDNLIPINFETERQIFLQKLYSDFNIKTDCYIVRKPTVKTYADILVDLPADSLIGYVGAENDTVFYWDKVHHTPAGYKIRGERIMVALNVLLKQN